MEATYSEETIYVWCCPGCGACNESPEDPEYLYDKDNLAVCNECGAEVEITRE